jgi:hypothetical protein
LFFGAIFVTALLGQALTGVAEYNHGQITAGLPKVTLLQYVTSSSFSVDVAENWQSEYLQFFLYIFATVWLVQKGSPESQSLDKQGPDSDEEQKIGEYADSHSPRWARASGFRLAAYSRSLGIVMGPDLRGELARAAHRWKGSLQRKQLNNLQDPDSYLAYVVSADFWNRTLQNRQSEFLTVGSMVVLSIYLRQRGAPESKPVGAPHTATGIEG